MKGRAGLGIENPGGGAGKNCPLPWELSGGGSGGGREWRWGVRRHLRKSTAVHSLQQPLRRQQDKGQQDDSSTRKDRDQGPGEKGRGGGWGHWSCPAHEGPSTLVYTAWLWLLHSPSCPFHTSLSEWLQQGIHFAVTSENAFRFPCSSLPSCGFSLGRRWTSVGSSLSSRLPHTLHAPPGWRLSSEL